MNPTITVTANVQSGVAGVRQYTKSLDEMRKSLRAAGGDIDKLASEEQELWDQLNEHVQQGLNTKLGASTRRRLASLGLADSHVADILRSRLSASDAQDRALKERLVGTFGGGAVSSSEASHSTVGGAFVRPIAAAGRGIARSFGLPLAELGAGSVLGVAGGLGAAALVDIGTGAYRGMQRERQRLPELDQFYRQLSTASGGFDALNDSVKKATSGLRLTYEQSQALVQQYAHGAALSNAGLAVNGMRDAVGFGRAYGLDPSSVVGALSTIERNGGGGVSNRRIEMALGDIASSAGKTVNMESMLQSLAQMIQEMRMTSGTAPDEKWLLSMFGAMNRSGNPALEGAAGGSTLDGALNSLKTGGRRSEAGLSFLYGQLARANPDIAGNPYLLEDLVQNPSMSAKQLGIGAGTSAGFDTALAALGIRKGGGALNKRDFIGSRTADILSGLFGFDNDEKAFAFAQAYIGGRDESVSPLAGLYAKYGLTADKVGPGAERQLRDIAEGHFGDVKNRLYGPRPDATIDGETGYVDYTAPQRWTRRMMGSEQDVIRDILAQGGERTQGSDIDSSNASLIRSNADLGEHLEGVASGMRDLSGAMQRILGGTYGSDLAATPSDRAQSAGATKK